MGINYIWFILGPVHTRDNDLRTSEFGSQNRPLSRNSNRNGSGQGCQFTLTGPLWPQVDPEQ